MLATIVMMALVAFALTNLGLDYRLADRFDAGLPRDHESDPAADLDVLGRILSRRRRPGMARLGDAPQSNDLRHGSPARKPLPGPSRALGSLPNLTFSALLTVAFAAVTYLGAVRVASRAVTA